MNLFDGFLMKAAAPAAEEATASHTPELPNFITILYHRFAHSAWAEFLHHWENVVFSLIIATLLWLVFHIGSRKKALVPSGLQNFLEIIVDGLRRFVLGILGPEGERFVPFLGTLFLYIFLMNLFGLIPAMKSPSSSINITAGLALSVFSLVLYLNIRNMGVGGFLYHLAGSPKGVLGWSLVPLMFPIELLTYLARPMTLALRLFGNIMGEDILIAAFAFMGIALVAVIKSPVGLPLQVPFMFLAMLTSLLQALVFTLLSAVYIALAVPHKAEH